MIGPFDGDWSDKEESGVLGTSSNKLDRRTSLHRQLPPWERTSFVGYQEWIRSEVNSSVQSGVQTGIRLGVELALDQNRIKMEKEINKMSSESASNNKNIEMKMNTIEKNMNQMREEIGFIASELHPINEKMDHLEKELQEIKSILLKQEQREKSEKANTSLINCLIM